MSYPLVPQPSRACVTISSHAQTHARRSSYAPSDCKSDLAAHKDEDIEAATHILDYGNIRPPAVRRWQLIAGAVPLVIALALMLGLGLGLGLNHHDGDAKLASAVATGNISLVNSAPLYTAAAGWTRSVAGHSSSAPAYFAPLYTAASAWTSSATSAPAAATVAAQIA